MSHFGTYRFALMAGLAATALVVAGCNRTSDRTLSGREKIAFDGAFFQTKAAHVDKADRSFFTASAAPASQTLDGARAAAEYQAITYCIENYGTSRITWTSGPDSDPAVLPNDKDQLILRGRCQR